jgi:hypothetical protein
MNMETGSYLETSVRIYQTTQSHIPQVRTHGNY